MSRNSRIAYAGICAGLVLMMNALAACLREEDPAGPSDRTGRVETCPFSVEMDSPEGCALETKSSFTDEQLQMITDLNVFVYHHGVLLDKCCRYFSDMDSLMLSFPYGLDGFNIYMVGNVGRLDPPADEVKAGELRYAVRSYDDFRTRGFPVAGVFMDYRKGELAHFRLKRLIGQYNVRVKVSASNTRYLIRDVALVNCARDVCPFGEDRRGTVFTCSCDDECVCGDRLSERDLNMLNLGGTVSLYFVENVQGTLLPYNYDMKKKIPSSIEDVEEGLSGRCTYMEMCVDVITSAARYENARYRFYLGQDPVSDFSIERNTVHNVTLDFTQNMVSEEEWRIETGPPDVVDVKVDKSEAMVIKGVEDMIFVQAIDNFRRLVDFNVELLAPDSKINVEKVETYYLGQKGLGRAWGFRFTSNADICGLYPIGAEPSYRTETVRISSKETYNGSPLYVRDFKVRVYDRLFPVSVKLEKPQAGTSPYEVVLRGENPMSLGLAVSGKFVYASVSDSIPESRIFDYIENGARVSRSMDMDGARFASLDAVVKPSSLSRIDFMVGGVSEAGDTVLAYPKLIDSEPVYVGEGNAAWFGPGSGMYPAKYPNLPDDTFFSIGYRDYGFDLGYTSSEWGGWTSKDDREAVYKRTQTPPFAEKEGFRHFDYKAVNTSRGNVYFMLTDSMGVHIPSVNGYKHADHGFQKENAAKYASCPFYFVNAGLTLFYTYALWHYEKVLYPNENSNGFTFKLYGPGRDLFQENSAGEAIDNVHEMKFWADRWKNLVGTTKTKQTAQSYKGQLYMTINGASTWTGCDTSEYGFFL